MTEKEAAVIKLMAELQLRPEVKAPAEFYNLYPINTNKNNLYLDNVKRLFLDDK